MMIDAKYRLLRMLGHQPWIPYGTDRIIRALAPPDRIGTHPFEVDFFGLRYEGNLTDHIDREVFFYGAYSRNEILLLRDLVAALRAAGGTALSFFDVGANVGQHSLFMSLHADRVISFEPFEPVRKKLLRKIEKNRIGNVTVFPVALGASDEDLQYFAPAGPNQGSGSFVHPPDNWSGTTRTLEVVRGDSFFAANHLPRIDVMKIDVEGSESAVFRGLQERLRADRPLILMEISGAARSGFGTETKFREECYDRCAIFDVGSRRGSGAYILRACNFASCQEILVVPEEKLPLLKHLLP